MINIKHIVYLGKREDIELADKIRQGYWKCRYGYWHSKNEECGHGLV